MILETKVLAFRLHVLQRAKGLGNTSAACRQRECREHSTPVERSDLRCTERTGHVRIEQQRVQRDEPS